MGVIEEVAAGVGALEPGAHEQRRRLEAAGGDHDLWRPHRQPRPVGTDALELPRAASATVEAHAGGGRLCQEPKALVLEHVRQSVKRREARVDGADAHTAEPQHAGRRPTGLEGRACGSGA